MCVPGLAFACTNIASSSVEPKTVGLNIACCKPHVGVFITELTSARSLLNSKFTTPESTKSNVRRLLAALESVMKQPYVGLFNNSGLATV